MPSSFSFLECSRELKKKTGDPRVGSSDSPSFTYSLCGQWILVYDGMVFCGFLYILMLFCVWCLGDRPPRSPGVDPKQLAAELQKVSQQQAPTSTSSSGLPPTTSATSSPGQPGSPSVSKKRHSSKASPWGETHRITEFFFYYQYDILQRIVTMPGR